MFNNDYVCKTIVMENADKSHQATIVHDARERDDVVAFHTFTVVSTYGYTAVVPDSLTIEEANDLCEELISLGYTVTYNQTF